MEIANSNDLNDISMDWKYLETHAVPQLDKKIDVSEIVADKLQFVVQLMSKIV